MQSHCAGASVCACNNAYDSIFNKGICMSVLPVVFLNVWIYQPAVTKHCVSPLSHTYSTHTLGGSDMFGCRLCWPHLRPLRPAECCIRPCRLIHSASAQTCHQMIYILHWHLLPPSLTSIQSIFNQHTCIGNTVWGQERERRLVNTGVRCCFFATVVFVVLLYFPFGTLHFGVWWISLLCCY